MQVARSVSAWMEKRRGLDGHRIGFVPTMGALHHGHAALVERCRQENQVTVVSIFVNPTQFNDPKDLERYPRTMERDLALLENLGVDEVLAPAAGELYPCGYRFKVVANNSAAPMEAACRPGFLDGVLTVVLKLLNMVRADRAYFGEKDFQQLRMVTEMARDFFVPTEIVGCATVREPSGLAASSRNALLSDHGRELAPGIYRALTRAANPEAARAMLEAEGFRVDYIEEHWGRRFAAAFLEGVRLIDNVPVGN